MYKKRLSENLVQMFEMKWLKCLPVVAGISGPAKKISSAVGYNA
jgi:hypothetical protein